MLRALVKRKQFHRHTHSRHKNNRENCGLFFPRWSCQLTYIVPPSLNEFIRNERRFCTLKRTADETWVNNNYYTKEVIELWNANMDIQPFGSNEYIAHYIAKSGPADVNEGAAQANRQITIIN